MKLLFVSGAAAIAIAGLAPAIAQTATQVSNTVSGHGTANAERVHTRADVPAKVARHFARVDSDRDGFVTKAEADSAAQAMRARIEQRMSARGGKNGMGAALFEQLDANSDGAISKAEADAAHAQHQGDRPRRGVDGLFVRFDANRDGSVSRAEFDTATAHRQHRQTDRRLGHAGHGGGMIGAHMFALADTNKDGRVSLQEAQTVALNHFDMADANRDGMVTRDERRQMRQRM